MKVLHIIPDDKFWLSPIQIFSSLSCENEYVCIVNRDFKRYQYIDSDVIVPYFIDSCKQLWTREDIDAYMFHSLPPFLYSKILEIPQNKIIIISTWGYDIYYPMYGISPIYPIKLYKKKTFVYVNRIDILTPLRFMYHFTKNLLPSNYKKQKLTAKEKKVLKSNQIAVVKRADFWATVLPSEYDLLSKLNGFKASYFPFQYAFKETAAPKELIDVNKAERILIGNSADPANNHFDLLAVIKKRKISNSLYLPLAYGDQEYADKIENYINCFKINAFVQRQFMPYEAYFSTLRSCRVGIFGHLRQQAVGNINACLMQGCKVFMYKDSISYRYYKSNGFIVFSIEDDLTQESVNEPLTEGQVYINLNKLNYFSFETVRGKVQATLEHIQQQLTKDI